MDIKIIRLILCTFKHVKALINFINFVWTANFTSPKPFSGLRDTAEALSFLDLGYDITNKYKRCKLISVYLTRNKSDINYQRSIYKEIKSNLAHFCKIITP